MATLFAFFKANNAPQILVPSSSFGIRIEYELGGPKKFKLFFRLETHWDSYSLSLSHTQTGWWFGCHFLFSHILGIIIPIDVPIFQRGGPTTNQQNNTYIAIDIMDHYPFQMGIFPEINHPFWGCPYSRNPPHMVDKSNNPITIWFMPFVTLVHGLCKPTWFIKFCNSNNYLITMDN